MEIKQIESVREDLRNLELLIRSTVASPESREIMKALIQLSGMLLNTVSNQLELIADMQEYIDELQEQVDSL